MSRFDSIVSSMRPITLGEMDSVRLMNRVDTKYLTDTSVLSSLLPELADEGYLVFEISGTRLSSYDSLYYDTEDYGMYLDHHNCRMNRKKVRVRRYMDTGDTYLEVKLKNNHGRTRKKRIPVDSTVYGDVMSAEGVPQWLSGYFLHVSGLLAPSVDTSFRRVTLVNPERTERVTVDMDVHFRNLRTGLEAGLGQAVIVEIKQDGLKHSRMRDILMSYRVKPYGISKYCMGTAMTVPDIKRNRFLGKIRTIAKINNQ